MNNANQKINLSLSAIPNHLNPAVIFDVGVCGGTKWLYKKFPNAKLILVEPLEVKKQVFTLLEGRDYTIVKCAAGSENKPVTIHHNLEIAALSSLNSRTPETKTAHKVVDEIVPMQTLENIAKEVGVLGQSFGLKIDAEGAEADILQGAQPLFADCMFIICELSLEARFMESPDFSEIILYLYNHGFKISKMLKIMRDNDGVTYLADILFEKIA